MAKCIKPNAKLKIAVIHHFTQSAGLVAIHPIAEAPEGKHFHFARLMGHEAFLRFNYDPDSVFSEKTDEHGFRK